MVLVDLLDLLAQGSLGRLGHRHAEQRCNGLAGQGMHLLERLPRLTTSGPCRERDVEGLGGGTRPDFLC